MMTITAASSLLLATLQPDSPRRRHTLSVVVWAHLASAAKHRDHLKPEFIGVDRGVCSARGDGWYEDKCRRDTSSGAANRSTCSVQVKLLCRILWVDNKEFVFPEIAASVCQTGYSTTGLVPTAPPSEALMATGILHPLLVLPTGFMWTLR